MIASVQFLGFFRRLERGKNVTRPLAVHPVRNGEERDFPLVRMVRGVINPHGLRALYHGPFCFFFGSFGRGRIISRRSSGACRTGMNGVIRLNSEHCFHAAIVSGRCQVNKQNSPTA